jgi:hypothetical protein
MALLDKSHRYDRLKAPFMGHALADLLVKRGAKYEFMGSFSFATDQEYQEMKFRDTTAADELKEIDPWTGEAKNVYTYEQIKAELPTFAEIIVEHEENLAEYAAYEGKRLRQYPDVKEQLDMLYKDIDQGLLGEGAKSSQFYTAIKAVKDASS